MKTVKMLHNNSKLNLVNIDESYEANCMYIFYEPLTMIVSCNSVKNGLIYFICFYVYTRK